MDRPRAQDCLLSAMSDDPVAVIYSASLWGIIFCGPGPRWKFAHLRLIRFTASKALCVARFEKVPVRPVRHLTFRYSLRNLRVGKAVFRPRPLNHQLGGRGRKTALVDSSALC